MNTYDIIERFILDIDTNESIMGKGDLTYQGAKNLMKTVFPSVAES
jgi:hypothetical protein